MSSARPEGRFPDTARRRLPRHQRRLLLAAGVAATVAVTWGGIAAVGTLAPAGAEVLSAPVSTGTAEQAAPSTVPGTAEPAEGTTSSGAAKTSTVPSPSPSGSASAPSPAPSSVPAEGTGGHVGHGAGTGAALPDAAGVPLTGEEPALADAGVSATPPGSQQELSLDAAAAQPVAAGSVAAAPAAGGGASRTEGLTPRAPIDPAEVTGGGSSSLGGCLPEYGTNGQCLPVVPPSMAEHAQQMVESGISLDTMPHPWFCTEVRQLFPEGLAVRQAGVDPQKLDTNGDGTACGTDD